MINKQKSAVFLYTNNEISEIESKKKIQFKVASAFIYRLDKQALLYSPENYIQYPIIKHNRKEHFLRRMYMYA